MFQRKFFSVAMWLLALPCFCRGEVKPLLESAQDGPTILLVTDPFTGDLSVDVTLAQIKSWSLTRGKVVTAPVRDMSAAIAKISPAEVVILQTERPVVTKAATQNAESTKNDASLEVRGVEPGPLLEQLNALTDEKAEQLKLMSGDADLPSGKIKTIRINLVVKSGGTVPSARVRLFRHAVNKVLRTNDMTTSDPWMVMAQSPGLINVAVYAGQGSSSSPGITAYPKALVMSQDVRFTYIGARELDRPGFMDQFKVVVFCGGMGKAQGIALGEKGGAIVRAFVKNGGGYVSSCAGSYLASSSFPWSLHIINSHVLDYEHWSRGMGDVQIEMTDDGKKIFGDADGQIKIHYANGPLLAPGDEALLGAFTPLAYYRSDMHKTAPGGVMPNTPAIIGASFGKGRVICFSPHPEYTAGLEGFIDKAVHWVIEQPNPTPVTGASLK